MNQIENIDQLLEMVGSSIDDVSSCEEDIAKLDDCFSLSYPDYLRPDITANDKKMLEEIKEGIRAFRKRTYIKTAFSYIEGILFAMKRILLEHSDKLTPKETIKLQEYKIVGPNAENLHEEPIFVRFEDNIKFTFKKYGELRANNYQINFNYKEWEIFIECIKIRNRITHPKHSNDLNVNDDEFNKCRDSYNWFFHILNDLQTHEIY